jgi:hypothetical protein
MESLECHISSPVKTICFFKSLLRAPPLRCQLVQGIRNWLVPASNARAAGDSPSGPEHLAQAGTVFFCSGLARESQTHG